MDKLIMVSGDSHATPPPEVWPEYLEKKYHHLLPEMHEDNKRYTDLLGMFSQFPPQLLEIIDTDGAWESGGWLGCWDPDLRIREMDREGCAAELVYLGDPRAIPMVAAMYRTYPQDAIAAGVRGYHRWVSDVFGPHKDRVLMVGDSGALPDMDQMLTELKWTADKGFVGTMMPMQSARDDLPPLQDTFWDPFWGACQDNNLTVVVHAGYGTAQGEFMEKLDGIKAKMYAEGRDDLLNEIINNAEDFFALDLRPRRAMWQLMFGGVFDRFPNLHLVMTEVRGDWMPATLKYLDDTFEQVRGQVPGTRRPSEYWRSNCITSLSFMHKAEVDLRHDIGIETIAFGRDYPHAEGTWPNTRDWLTDLLTGVPDDELALILGENLIRVLGLDRTHLKTIADRIGPTAADITGRTIDLDPRMVENWDARGGYLKPVEQIKPEAIDALLSKDVPLPARAG